MGECRDCAYSGRPIYKWPCDVCRATKNGRSMYCPEEADHIASDERKTDHISREAAIKAAMKDAGPVRPHDFNAGCARAANNIYAVPAADVRPMRPCDGCPFCVCEKYGVICPSDPDFRCDTRGGADG